MKKIVFPIDMSSPDQIRNRDVERILSGKAPADGGYDDLWLMVKELEASFPPEPIPPDTEKMHLAAMREIIRLQSGEDHGVTHQKDETSVSGTGKHGPESQRRRNVSSTFLRLRAFKIAAATVGVFAIFGGVAVAGALPGPVQSAVSHAAAYIGLEIPKAGGPPATPMIPADVNLPDEANVPASLPAATTPGTVDIPDHVSLPDQANVPPTVPVGPPSTVPVGPPSTVPVGPPSTVPVGPPSTAPPVTLPTTVPVTVHPTLPAHP